MRGRPVAGLVVAVVAGLLAACTGSSKAADAPSEQPVAAKSCSQVACEGTLQGARYRIVMPARWNGTLLLYSHGYRFAQPVPPDFAKPSTDAVPAPGEDVAKALLDDGYALAGSSYSRNGWAVREGVAADEKLYDYFAATIGRPRRVYLWGDSLGGLVTQTLAEKQLPWVRGAAALCGVLGGTNENLDVAVDVAYAVKVLLAPTLQLTGYASHQAAVAQWQVGQRAVVSAAARGGASAARLALVAALVDAPDQTSRFDGSTPDSRIGAAAEAVITGLGYGTYGRYEIEQRAGGNPSSNVGTDYRPRVSDSERAAIDALGGAGATDRLLRLLDAGRRVSASPAAREKAAALGEPSGDLRVPTITMHTTDDPLVLVQNERLFRDRVGSRGRTAQLLQLYVEPPKTYAAPAPYGAGHCNFTVAQRLAVVDLLDSWVRTRARPDAARLAVALYDARGVTKDFVPPPWPVVADS
ncbi:alpha/beta hydrolase [Angustibacter sp. Root456]|uniref:alpha/beta hydrolase n=1 Tax=Angustibacter sp. Root456 TaxID=1736539 RepID=UPI0006F58EC4|nr:alpha/beta hydrolase [Angustibacter sp. Root456]KQX66639.1 hypothetical protein ASD06_04585 [Angustibacter sp. Root456]